MARVSDIRKVLNECLRVPERERTDFNRGYLDGLSSCIGILGYETARRTCALDGCGTEFVIGGPMKRRYCCNSHKTLGYLRRKQEGGDDDESP